MKIYNSVFLKNDTEVSPLMATLSKIMVSESFSVDFMWSFVELHNEVLSIQDKFEKSRFGLVKKYGIKDGANYKVLQPNDKKYNEVKFLKFQEDFQKLCNIETKIKSKKPKIKRSDIKMKMTGVQLMVLKEVVNIL